MCRWTTFVLGLAIACLALGDLEAGCRGGGGRGRLFGRRAARNGSCQTEAIGYPRGYRGSCGCGEAGCAEGACSCGADCPAQATPVMRPVRTQQPKTLPQPARQP